MPLSSAEIKRQILMDSDRAEVKKRLLARMNKPEGLDENALVEMGENLESLTKTKGWGYLETYIFNKINPTAYLFLQGEEKVKNENKALGFIELIQWIDQHIKVKDEILAERQKDMK